MLQNYAAKFAAPAVQAAQSQIWTAKKLIRLLHAACGGAIGKKPASERSSERETARTKIDSASHTHKQTHTDMKR